MVYSTNEWSPLKQVILGSPNKMNWPFSYEEFPEAPFGPVGWEIIAESRNAMENYKNVLESFGVEVLRPIDQDYVSLNGFGAYSTRDTILIVGKKIIFCPTLFSERRIEWSAIKPLFPKDSEFIYAPLDQGIMFDAANIMRCNNDLIYLVSGSGNEKGAIWLQETLGSEYKIHVVRNLYSGHHIDSTIIPLREGLVMLNAGRANESHIPNFMKSWDKIWITEDDIVDTPSPLDIATKWIHMNIFSINENTIVINSIQEHIIRKLNRHKIISLGVDLPHTKYLLGAHHCTTLDTVREEK